MSEDPNSGDASAATSPPPPPSGAAAGTSLGAPLDKDGLGGKNQAVDPIDAASKPPPPPLKSALKRPSEDGIRRRPRGGGTGHLDKEDNGGGAFVDEESDGDDEDYSRFGVDWQAEVDPDHPPWSKEEDRMREEVG